VTVLAERLATAHTLLAAADVAVRAGLDGDGDADF
jgi:hypothetical protein